MPVSRDRLILDLCDSYRKSVISENGITIGSNNDKYRLRNNNICFHDLNYDEIRASCIGLTRTLLYKGLNAIVDYDHYFFWAWIGEVLLIQEAEYFTRNDEEISNLFSAIIRLCLTGCKAPVHSKVEWEKQREMTKYIDSNTKEVVLKQNLIVAYLSFPFLEATLKKYCCTYIDYSGKVKAPFKVGKRQYNAGGICSSLHDLLVLCHEQVASLNLRKDLDIILNYFSEISTEDPFKLIYQWRNASLHGSTNYSTIGGTVLNIAIIIALDSISERYEEIKNHAIHKVRWDLNTSDIIYNRSPWSYYPPFI